MRGTTTGTAPGGRERATRPWRVRARLAIAALVAGPLALALAGAAGTGTAPADAAGPNLQEQWGLAQIQAPAAWASGTGAGVRIAVVDTGIDANHADLAGKVVAAANCIGANGNPAACSAGGAADDNGHGTHVAGIAAGSGSSLIYGAAPSAELVAVKVLDSSGSGSIDDVAAGIEWAVHDAGARVVNLSLGPDVGLLGLNCITTGCSPSSAFTHAIQDAWDSGAIPVIAAGNNAGALFGPSGYGTIDAVVVAATGPDGSLASYSSTTGNAQWGVLAPGGDDPNGPTQPSCTSWDPAEILSTYWTSTNPDTCDATDEGTSMATPFVSGTLALLLGRGLTPDQAVHTLLATTQHGIVDAAAAMAAADQQAGLPPGSGGGTGPGGHGGSGTTGAGADTTGASPGHGPRLTAGQPPSPAAGAPGGSTPGTATTGTQRPAPSPTNPLALPATGLPPRSRGPGPLPAVVAVAGVAVVSVALALWRTRARRRAPARSG